MKKVLFSAFAALAFTSAGAAFADDVRDSTIQVYAANDYQLEAGEFDDFSYGYRLSTGDKVHFTQRGKQRYFVQLDGHKPERMYARSKGVFTTASGARVEFSEWGSNVSINNFEMLSPQMAQRGLSNVTVASR